MKVKRSNRENLPGVLGPRQIGRITERKNSHISRQRRILAICAAAGISGLGFTAHADTYGNNGGISLDLPGSWFDETTSTPAITAPGAGDLAQWDALSAGGAFNLDVPTSWLGIVIKNPTAAVVIGGGADATNTLTLGASGIDMSGATVNTTLNDLLSLGASQTWNVASGRVLTIDDFTVNPTGLTTNLNGNTLTITGAGNTVFGTSTAFQSSGTAGVGTAPVVTANTNSILGNGNIIKYGTGNLVISSSGNAINSVTVNNGTFSINMSAATANGATAVASIQVGTIFTGGGTILTQAGSRTSGSASNFAYVETIAGLNPQAGDSSFNETRGSSSRAIDQFLGTSVRSAGATVNLVDTITASTGANNANGGGYRIGTTGMVNGVIPWLTYTTTTASSAPGGTLIPGNPLAQGWFVSAGTGTNGTALATASYTASTDTTLGNSTQNVDVVNGATTNNANITGAGAVTVNTLRFNSGNSHQIIMGATDSLTIGAGGILVTGSYANHGARISGGTLIGGNPGSSSGNDLMIIDYADPNAGSNSHIQIDSPIADNTTNGNTLGVATALTKSGTGTLILTSTTSTYTGINYLNDGITQIAGESSTTGSLGAVPSSVIANDITFTGGTLQLGASLSLNVNRGITLSDKGGAIDTNGFNSTYGGIIAGAANTSGAFTKTGLGTLRLSSANTYAGNTIVNGGVLSAVNTSGSATSAGSVTVNSSGTLGGNGFVTGPVTLASNATAGLGGHVAPGDNGVGTLNLNSIALNSGSGLDAEFSGDTFGNYDLLKVNNTNGLTINGGGVNLFTAGSTAPYGTVGTHTYDLIAYNGSIGGTGGIASLQVLNPEPNFTYSFGTANVSGQNYVTLTVVGSNPLVVSNWISTGTPNANWSTPGNWSAGVPHSAGDTANFPSTAGLAMTVNMDAAESVGTLTFNNSASYSIQGSSTLTLDSGVPGAGSISDAAGSHLINVPVTLNSDAVIDVHSATDTLTFGLIISGTKAVTIGTGGVGTGTGTVIFNAANNYAGNTTINSGTLQLATGGALGGVNVTDNGTLTFASTGTYSFGGVVSGTGQIVQSGAGTTILSGANNYTGGTSITAGILRMGSPTALSTGNVTINSPGTLDVNGQAPTLPGLNGTGTIDNTAAGATLVTISNTTNASFSGAIQNTGGAVSLDKQGTGTQTLSGTNTYSGNTTIDAGVLSIGTDANLGSLSNTLTINTATLEVNATLSTARNIVLAGAPSTIQVDTGFTFTDTRSGGLSGTALTKSGAGTMVLPVPLSVTTGTTVSGGTLELQTSGNALGSTVAINGGGTLQVDSGVTLSMGTASLATAATNNGLLHLLSGSTFTDTATITLNGNSQSGGGGVITIDSGATATFTTLTSSVTADGATINVLGNATLGNVVLGRTGFTGSGSNTVPSYVHGLIVNGGTATASSLALNNTTGTAANSWATAALTGGSLTVTGPMSMGNQVTAGRGAAVEVTSGTFTAADSNNDLIQMSGTTGNVSQFSVAGGTANVYGFNMFPTTSVVTGASATIEVGGVIKATAPTGLGTLYVGAGGIPVSTSGNTASIVMAGGTLGASGDWASPSPVAFGSGTIQAADASGNPHNITLTGLIQDSSTATTNASPGGNFVKTGGGTLFLGGANNFSGNTQVNAGTLSFLASGSTVTNVDVGGGSATAPAALGGTGTVAFPGFSSVTIHGVEGGFAGHLAPGTFFAAGDSRNAIGTLNTSDLNINDTAILDYLLGTGNGSTTTAAGSLSSMTAVTGNLNLPSSGAKATLNIFDIGGLQSMSSGRFELFSFTSTNVPSGDISSDFNLPTAPAGSTFSVVNTGTEIDLIANIVAAVQQNLVWSGGSSVWDVGGGANWNANAATFNQGDIVTFDNANTGTTVVTINTTVQPASVAVNGSKSYSFSGSGGIANKSGGSTTLTQTGTGSLTISTVNTYTGATTIGTGSDTPTMTLTSAGKLATASLTVNAGATANINGLLTASPSVTVNGHAVLGVNDGTNGTLGSALVRTWGALSIGSGGKLDLTATTSANHASRTALVVPSLTNSGRIDLSNNDMIIHNGNTGSVSTVGSIANQLKTGFAGYWTGSTGIISSTAAGDTAFLTTLGYSTGGNSFDGQSTSATDMLVKYTYYGDANLDGLVNGADYQQIDLGFGSGATGWNKGDFNYDGVVNGSDFALIDNTFNQITARNAGSLAIVASPTVIDATPAVTSAVPEPATLGLLGIGAMGLLGRRTRRNSSMND